MQILQKQGEYQGKSSILAGKNHRFFYVVSTERDGGMVSAFEMKNAVKVIDPIW